MGKVLFPSLQCGSHCSEVQSQISRLRSLARELSEMAGQMEDTENTFISSQNMGTLLKESRYVSEAVAIESSSRSLLALAELCINLRKKRNKAFQEDIFGEPAWEILLDLFVHRLKGKKVTVTGVAYGTTAPATTVLRWLGVLEEKMLIERERAIADRRSGWIDLTTDGYSRMARFLLSWEQGLTGITRSGSAFEA